MILKSQYFVFFDFSHRCSLRIISMMQSTVVTCTGSAPARPTSRTEQGTLTKRRRTSSSRDITLKLFTCTISAAGAEAKLRQPDDDDNDNGRRRNIHTSFNKLLLIGSAHFRQLNMMVKKKKSHSCPHTRPCWLRVCVSLVLLFLRSSVDVLVGSVEFNMLEKTGF